MIMRNMIPSLFLSFIVLSLTVLPVPAQDLQATTPRLDGTNMAIAVQAVAEEIGRTVVSIHTVKVQRFQTRFYRDPFYDEFFRDFFEDFFGKIPEREFRRSGLGSGVIIDKRGYILTNEHVVGDADEITVTLPDGRDFKAELKGTDPRSDLAVIKIDAPNLPSALLGDSDKLHIGQWVVAIGNPFGHVLANPEPTVTVGVISALNRSLPRTSQRDTILSDLIQTDAAINPGNSGGPLVNLHGEVIGINVAIFSTSGGNQGIGFAIPVNRAKRIVKSLIQGQPVFYGWIGVSVQDIDKELGEYFNLPSQHGALVLQVMEDGPAKKAGIQDGDIILKVNNKEIRDVNSLINIVSAIEPGKTVPVEIRRDGKKHTLDITIGKRPMFDEYGNVTELEDGQDAISPDISGPGEWRGLTAEDINDQYARRFRLKDTKGVIVVDIDPDSPAAKANLKPGDVIRSINQQTVESLADFKRIVSEANGDCLVKTQRGYFVVKEE